MCTFHSRLWVIENNILECDIDARLGLVALDRATSTRFVHRQVSNENVTHICTLVSLTARWSRLITRLNLNCSSRTARMRDKRASLASAVTNDTRHA